MIIRADSGVTLPLADRSVDLVVTSVPYFLQRRYGKDPREHGREVGLEAWVRQQVAVFADVRRVLKPWGSLLLNVGDKRPTKGGNGWGGNYRGRPGIKKTRGAGREAVRGLKPGDLAGAPWRLALALQADGWRLRAEIIWEKPDASPETLYGWAWERHRVKVSAAPAGKSNGFVDGPPRRQRVYDPAKGGQSYSGSTEWEPCPGCKKCEATDGYVLRRGAWRPTTAHEPVFLLTPSAPCYWDQFATLEPTTGPSRTRRTENGKIPPGGRVQRSDSGDQRNARTVQRWLKGQLSAADYGLDVDHFASFPESLPAWAIAGGTSERGNCVACGAPWARIVERKAAGDERFTGRGGEDVRRPTLSNVTASWKSLGWRPTCSCDAGEPVPAVVLDPYGGAGTTALAAERLGRRAVSVDLYLPFCRLARRRIEVELRPHGEHVESIPRELAAITGPLFEGNPLW